MCVFRIFVGRFHHNVHNSKLLEEKRGPNKHRADGSRGGSVKLVQVLLACMSNAVFKSDQTQEPYVILLLISAFIRGMAQNGDPAHWHKDDRLLRPTYMISPKECKGILTWLQNFPDTIFQC